MYEATRQRIGEIIGEASMCWSETPSGVFNSDKALELLDEVMTHIQYPLKHRDDSDETMSQPKSNEELKNETNAKIYEYLDNFRDREVTEVPLSGLFKIVAEALAQKDAEVAEKREEIVGHGYRMAVRHLKEAYKHNRATTVPEAIKWIEDNARLFPTPKN